MIIAKQKRTENIAEYILYMWQLEDMIRAYSFNVSSIVSQFDYPQPLLQDIERWYNELVLAMKNEGIETSGHLMQIKELVQDLSELNIKLLQKPSEKAYQELFNDALPHIAEIVQRSNNTIKNEIDACLTGLYGLLVLRLQNKQVSAQTQEALRTFTKLLALLSQKFHAMERGELDI
jgi:hypothetical protein